MELMSLIRISAWFCLLFLMQVVVPVSEEVILAEERTTEEEKMHIIEGECVFVKFKFMLIMRCKISMAVKI